MFIYLVVLKAKEKHIKNKEKENLLGVLWIPGKLPEVGIEYFYSYPGTAKVEEQRGATSGSPEAPWTPLLFSEAPVLPCLSPSDRPVLCLLSTGQRISNSECECKTEKGHLMGSGPPPPPTRRTLPCAGTWPRLHHSSLQK